MECYNFRLSLYGRLFNLDLLLPFCHSCDFYGFIIEHRLVELICLLQDIQTYYYEHKYNFKFATEDNLPKEGTSASDFPLFKLGNQQNSVLTAILGKWQVRETTHPYKIFRYHYVNREIYIIQKVNGN